MYRIGYDVVSCVSSQNNVCDDEYVEQYQEYDVGYHGVLSHSLCGMDLIRSCCGNVNSPIENNANECGRHAHTRMSYRPDSYHAREFPV
jgi:hypothetical protein